MPLVTLTTDFGTADGYVGAMKGVLLSRCPRVTIVDITHAIPRHDIDHAAYVTSSIAKLFPTGAIHVAVVDPGVGSDRPAIIAEDRGRFFVGPDNGVFDLALGELAKCVEITNPAFMADTISSTFHGRDIFAPAAAALASGCAARDAGPGISASRKREHEELRVIHVDAFGNLITNMPPSAVHGRSWSIGSLRVDTLCSTYADVRTGDALAYIGSAGTIEVAIREGSAANIFGLGRGDRITFNGVSE